MISEREKELYQKLREIDPSKATAFYFLLKYHQGIENVIPRLEFIKKYNIELNDRKFRRFYSIIAPCAYVIKEGKKGIYWPDKPEDLNFMRSDLRKKGIGCFNRWKNISQSHPELIIPEQIPLFEEGELE